MKRFGYFSLGGILYIGLSLVLSSYGNMVAHSNINDAIIQRFQKRFLNGINTLDKYKNYNFVFDAKAGLPGQYVNKTGMRNIGEQKKSFSMKEWIMHGGKSADEPELPASLRHFYDPKEAPGQEYLHDRLDNIKKISLDFHPEIDHIEWAITAPEHTYNWENGKNMVKLALSSPDKDIKDESMAFAWRSLGETLHMIADMGCPSHVRDDAHPGLFEDITILEHFGDSDPYEKICESLVGNMVGWANNGAVDEGLRAKFRGAGRVDSIARELAIYTNKNFFTHETISGRSVVPKIHPHKTYPSPKLEDCTYDEAAHEYLKLISGHSVVMCRDVSYVIASFGARRCYPYVDRIAATSQAAALMPQIAEAGANVMRLFIPKLKVEITSFEDDVIRGKVKHYTDKEYTREIKYSGPVEILNSMSHKSLGEVNCVEGEFEEEIKISKRDVNWEDEGIVAEIELGNIYVQSPEFVATTSLYDVITINLSNTTNRFPLSNGGSLNNIGVYSDALGMTKPEDWIGYLQWTGDSFSTSYTDTVFATPTNQVTAVHSVNVSGRLSKNHDTLESFEGMTSTRVLDDVSSTYEQSISIKNLPIQDLGSHLCSDKIEGSDVRRYVTRAYYKETKILYTGEVEVGETNIDFNDPEIFFTVCFANYHFGK